MSPPLLLLPATEPGCSIGHFRHHLRRHTVPSTIAANAGLIGEAGTELRVGGPIRDAPRTEAVIIRLRCVDRSSVNVAAGLATAYARIVGRQDTFGRDGIG